MNKLYFTGLSLSFLAVLFCQGAQGLLAQGKSPSAQTQKSSFMRLANPQEGLRYGPGANTVVIGLMQSTYSEAEVRSFWLRLRAYRPIKQSFLIANEGGLRMDKALKSVKKLATGEHLYVFQATLKLPEELGPYLLRVDCFDSGAKNLIASHSVFLRLVTPGKPETKGKSHNSVTSEKMQD